MASLTLEETFAVDAPPESVWGYLIDPALVVTCLPGAALLSSSDDGLLHEGTVTVKLGTFGVSYAGSAEFVEVDPTARRLRVRAKGRESRGAGSADLAMDAEVRASEAGSEVSITATVNVTGKLVSLGRGMIDIVSEQMVGDFARCLCQKMAAPPAAAGAVETAAPAAAPAAGPGAGPPNAPPPASGVSILLRAIWRRIRKLVRLD